MMIEIRKYVKIMIELFKIFKMYYNKNIITII